jgi:hypothetical protein
MLEAAAMNMTELTVKLLLLFFPGIVCFLTVDALTVHRERKVHDIFLLAFVYGLLSYLSYAILKALLGMSITADDGLRIPPPSISIFRSLTNKDTGVDVVEVGFVTVLAVALAVSFSCAQNRYWFHDLARHLKITRKFGQPNVWSFALNANEVKWATVRDLDKNLMFQGYIRAFSDVEDPAEILLTQVSVYNEKTGELLYEADHVYLARDRADLTIEFPIVQN